MIKKFFLTTCLMLLPQSSFAAGKMYRINDCNGSPQQIGTVDSENPQISAEFPEASIPSGQEAVLTNQDTPQILKIPITEKKIAFRNVPEGEWNLCASPKKISFVDVDIK